MIPNKNSIRKIFEKKLTECDNKDKRLLLYSAIENYSVKTLKGWDEGYENLGYYLDLGDYIDDSLMELLENDRGFVFESATCRQLAEIWCGESLGTQKSRTFRYDKKRGLWQHIGITPTKNRKLK